MTRRILSQFHRNREFPVCDWIRAAPIAVVEQGNRMTATRIKFSISIIQLEIGRVIVGVVELRL